MKFDSKILVTGAAGLVGSAIVRQLHAYGYENVVGTTRADVDLTNQVATKAYFEATQPEYVFMAAAKVGGIGANSKYPADFIYDNLMIQTNSIDSAYRVGVKKVLFLGSVCIYPKFAAVPVKEESLLTGYLEPTNEAYAVAKIAGIKMCQAYHNQYGMQCASIMPPNLYGPNDNFNPEIGHVIPSLIAKFSANPDEVVLWGDGSAFREFMYVDDMADASILLMNNLIANGVVVNAAAGSEILVRDLAYLIAELMNYKGQISWDTSRPNGTPRRQLDGTKLTELGWKPTYSLRVGLERTIEWYRNNVK